MNWDDDAELEPLGEYEQDMLDRLKLPEGPRGCHWIGDDAQHCNKPLARLPSRAPYCEEHLRRSLTGPGSSKCAVPPPAARQPAGQYPGAPQ